MASKIFPVMGQCEQKKKPIGLQFANDSNESVAVVGTFLPTISDAKLSTTIEEKADLHIGTFKRKGCPACRQNTSLYMCCHCNTLVCYDGKEGKHTCPACGKTERVPASKDERIVCSGGGGKKHARIAVMMCMDVSGSMDDDMLSEMKKAATDYLKALPFGAQVGLVTFQSRVDLLVPLTPFHSRVKSAISELESYGGTQGPLGFVLKQGNFMRFWGKKYVLFFTDGEWEDPDEQQEYARRLREKGVTIIGIGTAGANHRFIESVSDPGASIVTTEGAYETAFAKALNIVSGN